MYMASKSICKLQRRAKVMALSMASGQVGEQLAHLLGRPEVLSGKVAALPGSVGQHFLLGQAGPGLVGLEILLVEKPHVIGRHQRTAGRNRQLHRPGQPVLLAGHAQTADFQIELAVEQLAQSLQRLGRRLTALGIRSAGQQPTHFTGPATGQRTQPLDMPFQPVALQSGHAVKPLIGIGARNQLQQVAVAGLVADQQHQIGETPALGLQRDFQTAYRFGTRLLHGLVEADKAEQVASVGHRQCADIAFPGLGGQLYRAGQAVHQAVARVHVQVGERLGRAHPDNPLRLP